MEIKDAIKEAYETATDKGWWSDPVKTFGECILLIHSELSEVVEDYRVGKGLNSIYLSKDEEPNGIPIELADAIIRIFDSCGHYGIDLEGALRQKMDYNKTRPYRHGGKRL